MWWGRDGGGGLVGGREGGGRGREGRQLGRARWGLGRISRGESSGGGGRSRGCGGQGQVSWEKIRACMWGRRCKSGQHVESPSGLTARDHERVPTASCAMRGGRRAAASSGRCAGERHTSDELRQGARARRARGRVFARPSHLRRWQSVRSARTRAGRAVDDRR